MDSDDLLETVRTDMRTELSRLGSSKSLYADTRGEMEPPAVLAAVADMTHHAASILEGWAEDDVEGVFAGGVECERDHHGDAVGDLDDHDPGDRPAAVEALSDAAGPVERLGALVGWTLVAEKKASQCTGFFTGQAKPTVASTFRAFGDDYERVRADALAALDSVCASDDDWEQATGAATAVVQAAYDEYFETLESLGVNPKPVC